MTRLEQIKKDREDFEKHLLPKYVEYSDSQGEEGSSLDDKDDTHHYNFKPTLGLIRESNAPITK